MAGPIFASINISKKNRWCQWRCTTNDYISTIWGGLYSVRDNAGNESGENFKWIQIQHQMFVEKFSSE